MAEDSVNVRSTNSSAAKTSPATSKSEWPDPQGGWVPIGQAVFRFGMAGFDGSTPSETPPGGTDLFSRETFEQSRIRSPAEQGCARGYWPRLAPVHLRAFDRSVAEGRVKTFGSVSKLPKDLWARLDVVEWQHGVARDSEGMVYYSLHADGPRRHPNDRKALRPFGAKLCCAGDPSEFPTARSIRDSSNHSDSAAIMKIVATPELRKQFPYDTRSKIRGRDKLAKTLRERARKLLSRKSNLLDALIGGFPTDGGELEKLLWRLDIRQSAPAAKNEND
jgi:hypothetical protein